MSEEYITNKEDLTAIADAIRSKSGKKRGGADLLTYPQEFVSGILDIETGTQTLVVTATVSNEDDVLLNVSATFEQVEEAFNQGKNIQLELNMGGNIFKSSYNVVRLDIGSTDIYFWDNVILNVDSVDNIVVYLVKNGDGDIWQYAIEQLVTDTDLLQYIQENVRQLPAYSNADKGKYLRVNDRGSTTEYVDPPSDVFIVNMTSDGKAVDKTFAKIKAAIDANKIVLLKLNGTILTLIAASSSEIVFTYMSSPTGDRIDNPFMLSVTILPDGTVEQTDPLNAYLATFKDVVKIEQQYGTNEIKLQSSTEGSEKWFKITVDDSGNITATETSEP